MLDAPKVLFQSNNSKYRATINLQKGLKIFSNAVESDKGPRPESSEQFSPGVMNFKLPLEVQIIECPALVKRGFNFSQITIRYMYMISLSYFQ